VSSVPRARAPPPNARAQVFHLDCIQRWLKTRSVCPLCNKEWEFAKIERIPGYGSLGT
jgi:RING-box protein 1